MFLSSSNWFHCRSTLSSSGCIIRPSLKFVGVLSSKQVFHASNLGPPPFSFIEKRSGFGQRIKVRSVSKLLDLDKTFFSSSSKFESIFWRMGDRMSQEVPELKDTTAEERPNKVNLTDAEWKQKLSPEVYSVCRNHGTERAWTGDLLDNKQKGVYTCGCCGVELFSSSAKFDSGSGWPSFYDVLKDKDVSKLPAVDIKQDNSYGMKRTEVLCGKCSGHLGHVFNDGPQPTGLRYCINSVSLKFKAEKDGNGGTSNGSSGKNNL